MYSNVHCDSLQFIATEVLPAHTHAYRLEDGTLFYHDYSWPHQLFVKSSGRQVSARLPFQEISNIAVNENALFFISNRKIYQAVFTPASVSTLAEVTVCFFRDMIEKESVLGGSLRVVLTNGQTRIYRLWEDYRDGIVVDDSAVQSLQLLGIYSGKALYARHGGYTRKGNPIVTTLRENVYEIALPNSVCSSTHNSSLVYIENGGTLFTLDTVTMDFLPFLRIESEFASSSLTGVHNDILTAMSVKNDEWYLTTAQLPQFYSRPKPIHPTAPPVPPTPAHNPDYHPPPLMPRPVLPVAALRSTTPAAAAAIFKPPPPPPPRHVPRSESLSEINAKRDEIETQLKSTIVEQTRQLQVHQAKIRELLAAEKQWREEKEEMQRKQKEMQKQIDDASKARTNQNEEVDRRVKELASENAQLRSQFSEMQTMQHEWRVGALQSAKRSLKFCEMEKLSKPLICIQLENGTLLYFDNAKPFELFTMIGKVRRNADLKILSAEFDCAFRGSIGNIAFFSTIRGKNIKFFKAEVNDGQIRLEMINQLITSELSLFNREPLYFIERSKEWSVYRYDENYSEVDGERFDITEIDLLSKYERHYHRGILYLFRESSTATIERVNEKVVRVEGPLLDQECTSIFTPAHSDSIHILSSQLKVMIILNTVNLTASQLCYEPPADSNNHSIVGIHEGVLTMAFDGVWGRHLATAKVK